jgi:hypothetical protein
MSFSQQNASTSLWWISVVTSSVSDMSGSKHRQTSSGLLQNKDTTIINKY